MTDNEKLYLLVFAIYLLHCIKWVKHWDTGFISHGFGWRSLSESVALRAEHGALIVLNPFPPLGRMIVISSASLTFGPNVLTELENFNASDDIDEGEVDRLAPKEQSALFDLIDNQFDGKNAETIYEALVKICSTLLIPCNVLFAYTFLFIPWAIYKNVSLPSLLIGEYLITAVISFAYWRAHARLAPSDWGERIKTTLGYLVFPPSAIRAQDQLLKFSNATLHPLVVGRVLCRPNYFETLAANTLRALHFPTHTEIERPVRRAAIDQTRESCERFLTSKEIDCEALLAEPTRHDETAQVYCPRCIAQFHADHVECPECDGVELKKFADA